MARRPQPPIYTLPHGIEVVGEYPPSETNRYRRVRIRPHPFFSCSEQNGGLYVRKSRVVASSMLGRALLSGEVVHHKNEDRGDDSPENLEVLTAGDHNREHKVGTKHSALTRTKISAGLRAAYKENRR